MTFQAARFQNGQDVALEQDGRLGCTERETLDEQEQRQDRADSHQDGPIH
jgi:hypothetical protein